MVCFEFQRNPLLADNIDWSITTWKLLYFSIHICKRQWHVLSCKVFVNGEWWISKKSMLATTSNDQLVWISWIHEWSTTWKPKSHLTACCAVDGRRVDVGLAAGHAAVFVLAALGICNSAGFTVADHGRRRAHSTCWHTQHTTPCHNTDDNVSYTYTSLLRLIQESSLILTNT